MSNNWEKVKLGDYINVKHGFAFKGVEFSETPTNDILVTPGNFATSGGFKTGKEKYYKGVVPEAYILKKDDVIVTMTDLSKNGDTLGYSALVPESEDKRYLHNQRIGLIEFLNDKIDLKFLYWRLRNRDYQKYIVGCASGTTVKHTSPTTIKKFEFMLPPLETQEKIANILSSLDDKIENNKRTAEKLEEIAQTLFNRWFVEFNFPNENGKPYKDNGGEMVESELGLIPKGWEVVELSELGNIVCGKTPSKSKPEYYGEDIPFIKIPDMHNNTFVLKSSEYLSNEGSNSQKNKLLPELSILVSCIATVGVVSFNVEKAHTNQQINSIVPYKDEYRYFTYCDLKLKKTLLENLGSAGSTTLNVNTSTFSKIKIIKPSEDMLLKFNSLTENIFNQIINIYSENEQLKTLRDTLLPKLMSGEMEV